MTKQKSTGGQATKANPKRGLVRRDSSNQAFPQTDILLAICLSLETKRPDQLLMSLIRGATERRAARTFGLFEDRELWCDPVGRFRMAKYDRVTVTPPPIACQHDEFDPGFSCRFPARREYVRAVRWCWSSSIVNRKTSASGVFLWLGQAHQQIKPLPHNISCTQGTKKLC
jgi:hypothetical protein